MPVFALVTTLYDLSEIKFSLELISTDTNKLKPTTIDKIRKTYTEDEIVQRIIQAELNGLQKIPYDITKNYFKLEQGDCQVFDDLLHIKTRLYVLPNKNNMLYTLIIKEVHSSIPEEYAERSSTYDCLC